MPRKSALTERSREQLRREEREIGANIPDEMVGLDSEDAADVERHAESPGPDAEKEGHATRQSFYKG